jgi:hypothetical protein
MVLDGLRGLLGLLVVDGTSVAGPAWADMRMQRSASQ